MKDSDFRGKLAINRQERFIAQAPSGVSLMDGTSNRVGRSPVECVFFPNEDGFETGSPLVTLNDFGLLGNIDCSSANKKFILVTLR